MPIPFGGQRNQVFREPVYTIIKDTVRELTAHRQEVFVPLVHPPGEALVDFGQALVNLNGPLRKVCFFVLALPYSDASFVMAFERECTETFWEGHVQAFAFFGGVPKRISYDNPKIAVAEIIGGGKGRRLTQVFCQLQGHYLFAHQFCRPARGNEKGVVEGQVKFTRLAEVIASWLQRDPKRHPLTMSSDLIAISQFCLYRRRFDPNGYMPEWIGPAPSVGSHFQAQILSRSQIKLLLKNIE